MGQILDSNGLKFFSCALSVACSLAMVFCPAGSVAYKLAEVLIPLLAGHGAVSTGLALKSSSAALTVAPMARAPEAVGPVVMQPGPAVDQQGLP
jgi:hypothetical protein